MGDLEMLEDYGGPAGQMREAGDGATSGSNVCRRIEAFLRINNLGCTFNEWFEYTLKWAGRWGKVRSADGGDCIQSVCVINPFTAYGKRDTAFIRVGYRFSIHFQY